MNAKGTRYTQIEIEKLASMYASGKSINKICNSLNRSETSVKNHLKKLNLFVPSEITEVETVDLNFTWLYWILIPLWIINPQTNLVDTILYLMFI